MTMVKCHKCGNNNEEGHEFCEECGSKLKVELKCKKCGHHLKPDEDFCEECGAKVKESKSSHHEHKAESTIGKHKRWIISGVIVLLLGVIFVFAVPIPYTAKEGYIEKVPYDEVYDIRNCKKVIPKFETSEITGQTPNGMLNLGFTLINYEDQIINFNYEITVTDCRGFGNVVDLRRGKGTAYQKQTVRIMENSLIPTECHTYSVISDEIEKCETTQSKKLNYKDEYKERFVTKHATLFQRWSGQAKYYYKVA